MTENGENGNERPDQESGQDNGFTDAETNNSGNFEEKSENDKKAEAITLVAGIFGKMAVRVRTLESLDEEKEGINRLLEEDEDREEFESQKYKERIKEIDGEIFVCLGQMGLILKNILNAHPLLSDDLKGKITEVKEVVEKGMQAFTEGEKIPIEEISSKIMSIDKRLSEQGQEVDEHVNRSEVQKILEKGKELEIVDQMLEQVDRLEQSVRGGMPISGHRDEIESCFLELGKRCTRLRQCALDQNKTWVLEIIITTLESVLEDLTDKGLTEKSLANFKSELERAQEIFKAQKDEAKSMLIGETGVSNTAITERLAQDTRNTMFVQEGEEEEPREEIREMEGIEQTGFQPQVPNVLPHTKPETSIVTPSDPEIRRQINKIRRLLDEGKKREAVEIIDEVCNSFISYQGLWRMRGGKKHNFMKPQEDLEYLNEFTRWLFEEYFIKSRHGELSTTNNKIFELGPGVGDEAVQFFERFPNLTEYYAIEGCDIAANMTRERLNQLKRPLIKFRVEESDFVRRLGEISLEIDEGSKEWVLPKNERRIVVCKSVLHYFWENVLKEVIMTNIHKIVWAGNGLLFLALKTPDADTWKEHIPIESKEGYKVGLHPEEAIMRAFMTIDKIKTILESVGFDIVAITPRTMRDYDFDGKEEDFCFVIAKPKQPRNRNGD